MSRGLAHVGTLHAKPCAPMLGFHAHHTNVRKPNERKEVER